MQDNLDRTLIALLRENARMPAAEMARRLGLARSTVQARIERLEHLGIIRGYVPVLADQIREGAIRALLLIAHTPQAQGAVIAAMRQMPEIERLYSCSGHYDLSALLSTQTTAQLDAAIDRIIAIEGVQDTETVVLLSEKLRRG